MSFQVSDENISKFAAELEREIAKYGKVEPKDLLAKQREQMESLADLEERFRKTLLAHPLGPKVYQRFVRMICDERRNILSARPYFRERQRVFSRQISTALKRKAPDGLWEFHFNFQFIKLAMGSYKFTYGKGHAELHRLYRQIQAVRRQLIETNLPLAMNRATTFWKHVPKSHLGYMDLLEICAEGLISGIDKFCLPFSRVFRSVTIGRMVGNMIESYSETSLHFYPNEKRKIYRANKVIHKHKTQDGVDWVGLAREINWDAENDCPVKEEFRTTPEEIADLIAAASCVSADQPLDDEVDRPQAVGVARFQAPPDSRPDVQVERREIQRKIQGAAGGVRVRGLTGKKLLLLRGMVPVSL